jgi:hypothetical protein
MRAQEGLALADAAAAPFEQAYARMWVAWLHALEHQPQDAVRWGREAVEICHEHGFAQVEAMAQVFLGWGMALTADPSKGCELLQTAITSFRATGARMLQPLHAALAAEALMAAERDSDATREIDEGLHAAEQTGERGHLAELQRLKGILLRRRGAQAEADQWLRTSLQTAQAQGATALEQRAARTLQTASPASG